jgi:CRISPR-associated endoribonuclease Cas6
MSSRMGTPNAAPARPDLYALVVVLIPDAHTVEPLGPESAAYAHSAFLDLVRRADPDVSAALHSGSERRPFTVSLLTERPTRRLAASGPTRAPRLRLTLLQPDLFAVLRRVVLSSGKPFHLRLGNRSFRPSELLLTPDSDLWAGHARYQDLGVRATSRRIAFEFTSPITFSLGQRPWGRRLEPVPLPALVFDSLWRKWNAFAPEELRLGTEIPRIAQEQVVISDLQGGTGDMPFPRSPQRGFVGRCAYDLKGEFAPEMLCALNALADFAFFAGVGYKTTMGMGQTRRVQ